MFEKYIGGIKDNDFATYFTRVYSLMIQQKENIYLHNKWRYESPYVNIRVNVRLFPELSCA
jgi:hypothetical protein